MKYHYIIYNITYFIKLNNIIECGFLVGRHQDHGHTKIWFELKLSHFDVCFKERMLVGAGIYCTVILRMLVRAEKQSGKQKEIAAL